MIFRVKYRSASFLPHVYCALFVGRSPDQTFVMCGTFQVRANEFDALKEACAGVEFVKDENLFPRARGTA